jgi:hypothetical protein
MAYFNHAFKKTFLATGATIASVPITNPTGGSLGTASTTGGFLNLASFGKPTYALNQIAAASTLVNGSYENNYVGLFTKDLVSVTSSQLTSCCPLYLVGSAIYCKDKISPFLGGYQETNKSKLINPKYVSRFYSVDSCPPTNNVVHVGSTYSSLGGGVLTGTAVGGTGYDPAPSTNIVVGTTTVTGTGTGLTLFINISAGGVPTVVGIASLGKGYEVGDTVNIDNGDTTLPVTTDSVYTINSVTPAIDPVISGTNCCKEFLCGETYSLRLDVKGSPALRFLNHNAYYTATAYTGCCPAGAIAPVAVDSTEVMILWANDLLNSPIVSPFFQIAIQDETGVIWYAPGTNAAFLAAEGADTWNNYVTPGHTVNACAGLIFNGAYVDTRFGDCTFQLSDFYEKQPINLYPSEVDLNGDPCEFTGICVVNECLGSQAMGLGETVLRDIILSESYRQNFFASDFRIREITQGNQIVNAINRQALYYRDYLQHSVPRFNNPSGTFDNDQYLLEVIFTDSTSAGAFETAVSGWLSTCGVCEIEVGVNGYNCLSTCTAVAFPALPAQCGF